MITVLHKLCTTKSYAIHKQLIGLYTKCQIKFHSSAYPKSIRTLCYNPNKFVKRNDSTAPFNINTNVQNNVFLYKHENWKFQRNLFFFGIGQFIICGIFFFLGFESILDPMLEDDNWTLKELFKEHFMSFMVCVITALLGPIIFTLIWFLVKRSIKYIILHKGGENLTLVTFHPLKRETRFSVPVNMVQAKASRENMRNHLPIKIKNHRLYYLLDVDGVFSNPILYDYTVGLHKTSMAF